MNFPLTDFSPYDHLEMGPKKRLPTYFKPPDEELEDSTNEEEEVEENKEEQEKQEEQPVTQA